MSAPECALAPGDQQLRRPCWMVPWARKGGSVLEEELTATLDTVVLPGACE